MNGASQIHGQCLCGKVRIQANAPDRTLRACHCDMCRQHGSAVFMSLQVDQQSITVAGPVAIYRSSEWAERGFCPNCGSTLWYATRHDGAKNLSAGLFPNAGNATLHQEYYSDHCPSGYALAGQHSKLTAKDTRALFAPDEGDTSHDEV